MKWVFGECLPGDMIRVKAGAVYHYGIFVSDAEVIQFGYPPLPEYAAKNDPPLVCAVDVDTFADGKIIERAELDRKEKKGVDPGVTVERARAALGTGGYNIIHNNCEHFAYGCMFGVKRSPTEESMRLKWQNFMKNKRAGN